MFDPLSLGVVALLTATLVGIILNRRAREADDRARYDARQLAEVARSAERCARERDAQLAIVPRASFTGPQKPPRVISLADRRRVLDAINSDAG